VASWGSRALDALVNGIPGRPGVVLGVTALASLLAVSLIVDLRTGAPRLVLDPSVNAMLPEDDEGRRFFERMQSEFEFGDTVVVAFVTDNVFEREHLESILRISERIEEQDEVHHVASLATSLNIRNEAGSLSIEPFYDEAPSEPEALAELRQRALSDPIYAGNLISEDGRIAVIATYLLDLPEQDLLMSGVDGRIRDILEEEKGNAEFWMAGGAHVKAETSRLMFEDVFKVVPFSVLAMAIVAFFSYRTLRGVFIPTTTVLISVLWTMAYIAAFYGQLNPVTVAAPPVLIVVGFAYSIHVLSAYYDHLRATPERKRSQRGAASVALRKVAIPVSLTGLTTAAGFFSLMMSPISAIKQFGAFCGSGVIATTIVSLTLTPALLALLPLARIEADAAEPNRFDRLLTRIGEFDLKHRKAVLTAWAVVGVFAIAGLFRIEVGTDMVSNFKRDNPVRLDFERVNDELTAANGFHVVVESVASEDFKEPANLAALATVQDWLAAQPEVGGSTSLRDYVEVIHQGFRDGDPAFLSIPESSDLVSQLLVVGANEELDRYVDFDYSIANVTVRTSAIDSADIMALVRRLETFLSELPANLTATVTGNTVLVARTMDEIALGQALSLAAAMGIIYVILAILFTSPRIGFVALIPNVLPVVIYFGVLGWTGVTLNVVTGLVACLVLGVAVDDTIHILVNFDRAARRYASEEKGVMDALRAVGRPVTYTTSALCIGFLILTASENKSQVEFGVLAAFTLGVAWLIDLTFTPAIAARMRVVTLWEVLTLDLGEDPHRSIPLFAGMSHSQARITALLATIRDLPEGFRLFTTGEPGGSMYVVISGKLSASVQNDGRRVALRTLERGDVIGEVALHSGIRSADVETVSAVRLLRIDRADLERLGRRYPRIALRVQTNLRNVLAERLVSVTQRV
jgi:predicted RND superfamily exporter protein